jgi:hypothetical protein
VLRAAYLSFSSSRKRLAYSDRVVSHALHYVFLKEAGDDNQILDSIRKQSKIRRVESPSSCKEKEPFAYRPLIKPRPSCSTTCVSIATFVPRVTTQVAWNGMDSRANTHGLSLISSAQEQATRDLRLRKMTHPKALMEFPLSLLQLPLCLTSSCWPAVGTAAEKERANGAVLIHL